MKLKNKAIAWLAVSAMCVGMLTGCGGGGEAQDDTAGKTETESSEESQSSGDKVLRYQVSTIVDSMDPALSNDYTSCGVLSQCMMGLFTKDANGAPALGMAESEEKSDDGLTLTFKIREDAVWANGDPVTANDFVFAWRRVADPKMASDYQFFIQTACIVNADDVVAGNKPVEELGVEAVDDKTLVVNLSSPCSIFDYLMTSTCFLPLSQSFVEECGDELIR